jgi:hypothetical protein
MNRREFLISTTAVAAVMRAARLDAQAARLARIGISSANFAAIIKTGAGPEAASTSRTLDFLDLPQMVADKYGVHHLELNHSQFVWTETAYLKDLKDRLTRAKSTVTQINTNFQTSNVSTAAFSGRAQALDLAKQWIDHAETLGCPRVSITLGSVDGAGRQTTSDSLKILSAYGKAHKVNVVLDNRDDGTVVAPPPAGAGGGRGGAPVIPATWQTLVEIIQAAGVNACPDPAGFPSAAEASAGLKALYPLSDGNSRVRMNAKIDLPAAIKISKDASYKGLYTIVADGEAGTKAAVDALLKLI